MLRKWISIFSLVLSLGLVWAQVNIVPTRTDVSGFPDWTDTSVAGTSYLQLLVAGANTVSPAMSFDDYTSETLDFKARTYGGVNTVENEITVSISIDNGSNWTVLGTRLPTSNTLTNMEQFDLSAYNGSQVKIKFEVAGTNNGVGAGLDDINIRGVSSDPTAVAPTFNPVAGTYLSTQYVSISSTTPGASIYYTLDGSTPTNASTPYTSTITISQTTTVKAIAYATGYLPSSVATAAYVIATPNYATIPYTQDFATSLGDTYTHSVSGPTKTWYHYSTGGAAAINGYDSGDTEEDWLILPGINMNTNGYEKMSFDTWYNFGTLGESNYLKLYYSSNYAGIGDPTTATWTEVSFTQPSSTSTWTGSGLLDLSGVTGTAVFFAFKYYSVPGNYSSWNIDNISIINLPPDQPLLTVNPATLTGFTYITGEGPSAAQMFSVSGTNLTASVIVQAPANYEISINETAGFTSTITLTQAGGTVAETPLYARLEAGLSIGNYNELITVNSTGATEASVSLNGSVTGLPPSAQILHRPAQISLANATDQSAVLVQVSNYSSDDARYRLYNDSNQYYPWNAATGDWVSSNSYGSGPQIPGTPSSSSTWWIPFQRGNNSTTSASYRDRLSPYSSNYQTAALPTATAITTPVPILSSQVNFTTWDDYTQKYIVLAYDAAETLIAASSTDLDSGAFTVLVQDGTTITRIEIRDVLNTLIEAVTGTWPQVLNPQITVSGSIDFLYNVSGQPAEEFGSYTVSGQDLTEGISVQAPTHFELTLDSVNGPWTSSLSLVPTFNGTVFVRINSDVVGEHSGNITHNSSGATEAIIRVEGETLAPEGEIIVDSDMTPFTQDAGTPSAHQTYSLSSTGLSGDITITTSTPFELSSDAGTNWASSIAVSHAFNGLIYVRMNSAEVGTFENIVIEHSNPNTSPVSITVSGTATPAFGPVHNLFFSEYIEGSSNNKAIEIYNASGQSVDLSRYQVELYRNGAATPGNTLIMSGILAAGEVYVIANSEAITGILAQADVTSTVTYFNGDDALALRCLNPDTLIDVIGTIGTDPGDYWPVAGVANATLNHTLVRKPTVATGSTDWALQQGTDEASSQWIVHPSDYTDDLGTHTYSSGALESPIVTITQNGTNVLLAWPDVDGASGYRVESSDNPYTGFSTLGTTNDITYSTPASTAKKFFRVIALP